MRSFLDLPPELRVQVYQEHLTPSPPHAKYRFNPSILLVNKMIYEEARHAFYKDNVYYYTLDFLDFLGPRLLYHLTLRFNPAWQFVEAPFQMLALHLEQNDDLLRIRSLIYETATELLVTALEAACIQISKTLALEMVQIIVGRELTLFLCNIVSYVLDFCGAEPPQEVRERYLAILQPLSLLLTTPAGGRRKVKFVEAGGSAMVQLERTFGACFDLDFWIYQVAIRDGVLARPTSGGGI
ncbi:hypothetical protein MMC28_010346 [Mycoblastus sanguinarius]|nr:hypothetical protein [Mycoblastus sanguinarius]